MTARYLVVPFKRWHLGWLEETGVAEAGSYYMLSPEVLHYLEMQNSRTVFLDDGKPIMCGGVLQQWPGRHVAWAYLGKRSAPHMRFITRETRKYLAAIPGRLEMTVRCDFAAGHKWAKMLDFSVETYTMKSYGPVGEDHSMYVRFN